MIELSGTHGDGAHPYLMPPEHTAMARKILGQDKLLCVEQKVVFEKDAAKARKAGYEAMKYNLMLPNYRTQLHTFGFSDADMDGPSGKLVDALIAWGDEKTIAARIKAHLDAGATQVCIQPVRADGGPGPDMRILEILAPG
jgi:probable F420-dependent oxidoreductase